MHTLLDCPLRKYEDIKDKIRSVIVNTKENAELEAEYVNLKTEIEGMSCFLYVMSEDGHGLDLIRWAEADVWKLIDSQISSGIELFDQADANTLREFSLVSLPQMLEKMAPMFNYDPNIDMIAEGCPFRILTNKDTNYGFSQVFIKESLERVKRMLGDDFYIIPSSIHEALVLSKNFFEVSGMPVDDILQIIREVNISLRKGNVLSKGIYLSDSLYFYDGKVKKIA